MKQRDILFILGAAAVLLLLYYLSTIGRKPPALPPDAVHISATTNEACRECHAKDKASPLRQGHPFKEQCLECHKMKAVGHGVMR